MTFKTHRILNEEKKSINFKKALKKIKKVAEKHVSENMDGIYDEISHWDYPDVTSNLDVTKDEEDTLDEEFTKARDNEIRRRF